MRASILFQKCKSATNLLCPLSIVHCPIGAIIEKDQASFEILSYKGGRQHEFVVIVDENVFSPGFSRRRLQTFASTSQNVDRATSLQHGREFSHFSQKYQSLH